MSNSKTKSIFIFLKVKPNNQIVNFMLVRVKSKAQMANSTDRYGRATELSLKRKVELQMKCWHGSPQQNSTFSMF